MPSDANSPAPLVVSQEDYAWDTLTSRLRSSRSRTLKERFERDWLLCELEHENRAEGE